MKKTITKLLLAVVSTALVFPILAQELTFQRMSIKDGLSQNTVNCILKDSRGFMWFGTNEGLNRYNGYDFKVYRYEQNDTASLSDNKVYDLLEDEKGRIWVATRNGLNCYDYDSNKFQRYLYHSQKTAKPAENTFVRTLHLDERGRLWAGTLGKGLFYRATDNDHFVRYPISCGDSLKDLGQVGHISSLIGDGNGGLWVGTQSAGICRIKLQENTFQFIPFPKAANLAKGSFGKTLHIDRTGALWICTEKLGLYRLDTAELSFTHYHQHAKDFALSGDIVKDILEDAQGRLWLAIDGGGLNIIEPQTSSIKKLFYDFNDPHSLSSNAVYSLYQDNQGIIWVGTFNGGISFYNPNRKAIAHYTQTAGNSSLSHRAVLSFLEDEDGDFWVGTDGGGLNFFDRQKGAFQHLTHDPAKPNSLSSNAVTSLYQDVQGNFWVGTYAGGLNLLDKDEGTFETYKYEPGNSHSISNNNVWSMLEDSQGNLWIGTLGGLNLLDRKNMQFQRIGDGKDDLVRVTCLEEDSRGHLWIGGNGIYRYDIGQESLKNFPQMTNLDVRSIYEDSRQQLWICTEGSGLFYFDPEQQTIQRYTVKEGLPSNAVHQVLEDAEGNFWISTNKGISRFEAAITLPEQPIFRNYDESDGLQSSQFSYSAALKASDGYMFFGGVNGFNVFHPDSISDNPFVPPVMISGLKINEKELEIGGENSPLAKQVTETKHLTVTHKDAVITFEFTALNYTSPDKNRYAYQMEGFRDEWTMAGNKRTATYTNLDPGDYTFRVKAANNDGIWNEAGASIDLTVLPPPWKTTWAYLIYLSVFLALLLSFRSHAIERIKLKNDIQIKELEKEKNEELNQMKLKFFTNISHEFRTPITLILGPLEKLIDSEKGSTSARKQLLLIHRNASRLLKLINQLLDFRKADRANALLEVEPVEVVSFLREIKSAFDEFAQQHHIEFTFESDVETKTLWCDPDKIDKVFYNLLSNAFKFTPDKGRIAVALQTASSGKGQEAESVTVLVKDTGIGISKEKLPKIFERFYRVNSSYKSRLNLDHASSGIGLAFTKELMEMHKGEIAVESELGKGSTFSLTFQLGNGHFEPNQLKDSNLEVESFQNQLDQFLEYKSISYQSVVQDLENELLEGQEDIPLVLIIDDNPDMRTFVAENLKGKYRIRQAGDGKQGLEIAFREIPDLVVCDVMMPVMDGMECCRLLKQDERTSHIPVLMLTAKATVDASIEGLQEGADDYVTKPFHMQVLTVRIENLIENRKKLREKFNQDLVSPSFVKLPSQEKAFLKKIVQLVEDHMEDPTFDVTTFVREIGLSRSVLYRKIRAVTNQSVNEFITSLRLKRAAQLLQQRQQSISEVAYEVGYNDPQYFSKCFRKQFGKTPSAFMADVSKAS